VLLECGFIGAWRQAGWVPGRPLVTGYCAAARQATRQWLAVIRLVSG
jgi:hypothetical protein